MNNINAITLILAGLAVIPLVKGACESFTKERLLYSVAAFIENIEFLLGLVISIYLTKRIFFEYDSSTVFGRIYSWIPQGIKTMLYGRDVMTYILSVPVIMLLSILLMQVVSRPFYKYVLIPAVEGIYSIIDGFGFLLKRALGILWQVPRSAFLVLLCGLLLNFYTYYFPSPLLSRLMNESKAYQILYKKAIYPALNSNIAKRIPVLVNDSFQEIGRIIPIKGKTGIPDLPEKIKEQLEKRNIRIVEYFNGVTLEEAIKSSPQIDEKALEITGKEKNTKKKAILLYKWVSTNVEYDYEKAEKLSKDPKGTSSGALVAFETRKGVCFDYSCLYIAMCRAAGIKVRLVTGLAYSGVSWGDHAWNQVYCPEEERWVDVDPTFGNVANYFDKRDFDVDHKYAQVQAEW